MLNIQCIFSEHRNNKCYETQKKEVLIGLSICHQECESDDHDEEGGDDDDGDHQVEKLFSVFFFFVANGGWSKLGCLFVAIFSGLVWYLRVKPENITVLHYEG